MRIKTIKLKNVLPVKHFSAENLSDVVVLAGPNGVGKTRLIEGLLLFFQNPNPQANIRLVIEATCQTERTDWGKHILDTSLLDDAQRLRKTLQKNRQRSNLESSVLNFESDRTIQQITPFNFSWDFQDPWLESIGWNTTFTGLRNRFQDTLHSLFRKVRSRSEEIAKTVESLIKAKKDVTIAVTDYTESPDPYIKIDPNDFPDPIAPFKRAFRQLLAPKELLDADPKKQQLDYRFEGQTFSINSLSSGEREVVNIVFDFLLRNPKDCIVVFDEPELHLHPELSYKLLQTLRSIGVNNQFIFCTHSADIITASLESSVIFIAPPKDENTNQAILVREEDETHQALKLLGQSIGIIALGKKIVLIEGSHSSLDKQTYGAILKDRFPNLVLVPGGGKGILGSFAFLHKEVLEKTIWGVEFFMLCDRDAVPPSKLDDAFASNERVAVLKRYHVENYFLDETVLAKIFATMEPDQSWLRSPQEIRSQLKTIARDLVSYTAALTASAYFRESVGNVDLMPKDCHAKNADELVNLITSRASEEKARVENRLDSTTIEEYVRRTTAHIEKSLAEDTDEWKRLVPGRQILAIFASKSKLDVARIKLSFLKAAETHAPYPFQEIVDVFARFDGK